MPLKRLYLIMIFLVAFSLPVYATSDMPSLPALCYGRITIEGMEAPAGTQVIAKVDGAIVGSIVTEENGLFGGSGTKSKLAISGNNLEGKVIKFYASGISNGVTFSDIELGEMIYWGSGEVKSINLPVASEVSNPNCFIATAAYGSYLDPHVGVLRQFRDDVLLKSRPGRWFIDKYYHYSPPIAAYIAVNEPLRFAVRLLLTPLVFAVQLPCNSLFMIMTIIISLLLVHKMRRRPDEKRVP